MMFCENCGKQIPDNSTFCEECGAKTGGEIAGQAPPPPPRSERYVPTSAKLPQSYYEQPKQGKGWIIYLCAVFAFILLLVGAFFVKEYLDNKTPSGENPPAVEQTNEQEASEPTEQTPPEPKNAYEDYRGYTDTELPSIGDFFWFTEDVKWDGLPAGRTAITDFGSIAGYWKAYTETISTFEGEEEISKWFNAEISGDANQASFTYHTKGFTGLSGIDGTVDISHEDGGNLKGRFSDGQLVLGDIVSKGIEVIIKDFYTLNGQQYAVGEVKITSGEKEHIVLVRP